MLDNLKEIIKEICVDKNIEYKTLSKDWIIFIGKCALYKQHVSEMRYYETRSSKTGLTHEVIFHTQSDEAYTFWIEPKESIEKVEQWLKQ